ncbi:hypothetical protein B0H11DRAFT_718005 [Mycena galericulata]|nr:hypothetical protein B0H11DRAFT_718005 [Mycena galericulata]
MTEASLFFCLTLSLLIRRSAGLPVVDRPYSNGPNAASSGGIILASGFQVQGRSSAVTSAAAITVASGFAVIPGILDPLSSLLPPSTTTASSGGLIFASGFQVQGKPSTVTSAAAITVASGFALVPGILDSSSSLLPPFTTTAVFVPPITITTDGSTQTLTPVSSSTPSSGESAIFPLPVNPILQTVSVGQAAPPAIQLTNSVPTSPPAGQTPLTNAPSTATSSFGNDVLVSASVTETLSASTSIFTTSSDSIFTTGGHVTSTEIPVLTTSVSWIRVPVPTQSSAQGTAKSSGLSTSARSGIAVAGVTVFLLFVLVFIIIRRRTLRNRAFLRVGEEF